MKIRQSVGICISLGMLLSGCRSGMYSIDTDGKSDSNKDKLPYRIVDALDPKSYSVDYLPVEVNVSKSKGSDDSVALCCLTLGIIPAFYDDYENYRVMVQTPIGTKLGTGSIHAKSWVGWICLIPYPGAADFRSNDPKLPDRVMEKQLQDQLVEQLVSQFSKEEYASYVKDLKEKREKEARRVEQKVHKIESLLTAGKFEDALKLCGEERDGLQLEEPWLTLEGKVMAAFKNAVPTINAPEQLVGLFQVVGDSETRDAIVLRLSSLNQIKALTPDMLEKMVNASSNCAAKVAAIRGIANKAVLMKIANEEQGFGNTCTEVTVAALKQIGKKDDIRKEIWVDSTSDGVKCAYVKAFGDESELIGLINDYPLQVSSTVAATMRECVRTDALVSALNSLERKAMVATLTKMKFSFEAYVKELEKISDKEVRAQVAYEALLQNMRSAPPRPNPKDFNSKEGFKAAIVRWYEQEENASRKGIRISDYDMEKWDRRYMAIYCAMLGKPGCEKFFDVIDEESLVGDWGLLVAALIRNFSKEGFDGRVAAALKKAQESGRIVFEGFYCGMPYKDYVLMGMKTKRMPETGYSNWYYGCDVRSLEFDRKTRYALLEAEDGEFWPMFMKKYIPRKQKSVGEVIGEALDSGRYDYQEGYDDSWDERCYFWKSMKYKTKIKYGLKSGRLKMEEDS